MVIVLVCQTALYYGDAAPPHAGMHQSTHAKLGSFVFELLMASWRKWNEATDKWTPAGNAYLPSRTSVFPNDSQQYALPRCPV